MAGSTDAGIRRVRLLAYRSILECDVLLGPLAYLVGPNGSGKSNFLDALHLVADALDASLEQALRARGGLAEIMSRGHDQGRTARIEIEVQLADDGAATYALDLGPLTKTLVASEECRVSLPGTEAFFTTRLGEILSSEPLLPSPGPDRLYLPSAASLPVFRPVFDVLRQMAFYDFNLGVIKAPQNPDSGTRLAPDGSNLASVIERLGKDAPEQKRIIEEYLGAVVPGVAGVEGVPLESYRSLVFQQRLGRFAARSVSDGTLRALAVLTAAFQDAPGLIGMEEPETGVHPAAAAVLREALTEASRHRQLVVTSHSPELLDDPGIAAESIVAVRASDGVTELGPLDGAGQLALREHLYTAGELLRLDQLSPVPGGNPEARA
jgi:predicted ATPase